MRIIVFKFTGGLATAVEGRMRIITRITSALEEGLSPVVVISAQCGNEEYPYRVDALSKLVNLTNKDLNPRDMDLLLSCGEIITAILMTQALEAYGIAAVALTGGQAGIITDGVHGKAEVLQVTPDKVLRHLGEGKVVVVAGEQGVDNQGEITRFGFEGDDVAVLMLASALEAECLEIYAGEQERRVDHEKIVHDGTVRRLSYQELCESAEYTSKTKQERVFTLAQNNTLPIRIKNIVTEEDEVVVTRKGGQVVHSITQLSGLAHISVRTKEGLLATIDGVRVFKTLAGAGINVDMNIVSPDRISFVVNNDLGAKVLSLLEPFDFDLTSEMNCGKISLIGEGIQHIPGIMARVVESLHEEGVTVLTTTDSEITISCLVRENQRERAVQRLCQEFGLLVQ